MSGPGVLRLKRKATELPPDTLILQRDAKRTQIRSVAITGRYILQSPPPNEQRKCPAAPPAAQAVGSRTKRVFQIRNLPQSKLLRQARPGGAADGNIATIVERRARQDLASSVNEPSLASSSARTPNSSLKRPGRGAAIATGHRPLPPAWRDPTKENSQLASVADSLHEFAKEEVAKSTKPKLLATPKLSGHRSRELHQQRLAATSSPAGGTQDVDMLDDDGEYVYDTYIFAPAPSLASQHDPSSATSDASSPGANVGYIVITDEDQAIWETLLDMHDSESDASDDEDENAEDWYGADYPEDEVASDDEFDRNAYRYRGNADSDEEQWDERTGAGSDDEEVSATERMLKKLLAKHENSTMGQVDG